MISVYMQKRCLLVFDEFCSCLKAQRAELGLNQRQSLSSCPQEHTRKTFSETKQPKAKELFSPPSVNLLSAKQLFSQPISKYHCKSLNNRIRRYIMRILIQPMKEGRMKGKIPSFAAFSQKGRV